MPTCKTRIRRKRLTSVKANGMYRKTTLCKYRNDRRWHPFANKKTPCQPNSCANVLQKSWWCGVCSSRKCTVPHVAVSTQARWLAPSLKKHVDSFHHADHHLSTRTYQILVVWCSSQKPYSTNVAKIITGTLSQPKTLNKFQMRTNTSGQDTFKRDNAKCLSRDHTVQHLQR